MNSTMYSMQVKQQFVCADIAYTFSERKGYDLFKPGNQTIVYSNKERQYGHIEGIVNSLPFPAYFKTETFNGLEFCFTNRLLNVLLVLDSATCIRGLSNSDISQLNQLLVPRKVLNEISEVEQQAIAKRQTISNYRVPIFLNNNGYIVILSINAVPIIDNNKVCGVMCTLDDLSEKHLSMELLMLYKKHYSKEREAIKMFIDHIGLSCEFAVKGDSLSCRELDCLIQLAEGKSAKETARALGISSRTVETHLDSIKFKFNSRKKCEVLSIFKTYYS